MKKIFLTISLIIFLTVCIEETAGIKKDDRINRFNLVNRHNPGLTGADSLSPFTVGNGEFAFTADITGLQTFSEFYENGIPLGTQSQWGWHSVPDEMNYSPEQTYEYYDVRGRKIPYASGQHSDAGQVLRANPHRLHLGRIGFQILRSDSSEVHMSDIKDIDQSLDLWKGIIFSSFSFIDENDPVFNRIEVETACHPDIDQVAIRIKSSLLKEKRVSIFFRFPYGSLSWGKNPADWMSPGKHTSEIIFQDDKSVRIKRTLDNDIYFTAIRWEGSAEFKETGSHFFILTISEEDSFSFVVNFSPSGFINESPDAQKTFLQSEKHWKNFWETGGALDLSESTDPRAFELERRIILSRYLTAVQCAGSLPPQETGLTFNSWYGKFHLEMHWWHAVHFVLWNKTALFEKSIDWYKRILPAAKRTAAEQGYTGARWPKMTSYDGRESPSTIGVFLIWQQPHPIYYAELLYSQKKEEAVLLKYKDIVFETAEFMASYARWDEQNKRYVLGPPLIPAQEIYKPDSTINPSFELSYWKYGLTTAQKWCERLRLKRNEKWDDVIKSLSRLPVKDNLYQNVEGRNNTLDDILQRSDHPTVLGAFGMIPNDSIDTGVMKNTLIKIMQTWNWETTWGWDYPLIAMTAARVGLPEVAINALLMDVQKNTYLNNGHNYQDKNLTIYLPGNGGLLTAVAMMAAGWAGAPGTEAPGFPKNSGWVVKYEGLNPLP